MKVLMKMSEKAGYKIVNSVTITVLQQTHTQSTCREKGAGRIQPKMNEAV